AGTARRHVPTGGGAHPSPSSHTGPAGPDGAGPSQSAATGGPTVVGHSTGLPGPAPQPRGGGAVVSVTMDRGMVGGIAVRGRPPHPFPGREGSHTTAWAVDGDAVRRGVVGPPPGAAGARPRPRT